MPELKLINRFDGDYAFLSNFFPHPIVSAGKEYPTTEHYYQAMKTLDKDRREAIRNAKSPGVAKRMGNHKLTVLREDWEDIKVGVMERALYLKFTTGDFEWLATKLLQTGDAILQEGNNWHDMFWGVCNCKEHRDILPSDEVQRNMLGRMLMKIRGELRRAAEQTHPTTVVEEGNDTKEDNTVSDETKKALVTNLRLGKAKGFYVGRSRRGNVWANDWSHLPPTQGMAIHPGCTNPEESVFAFTDWLLNGTDRRAEFLRREITNGKLHGELLLCWCSPVKTASGELHAKPCHANTLGAISNQIHVKGIPAEEVFDKWRKLTEEVRALFPAYQRCDERCTHHNWPSTEESEMVLNSGLVVPESIIEDDDDRMFAEAWQEWCKVIVRGALIEPMPKSGLALKDWAKRAKEEITIVCSKCDGSGQFQVRPGKPGRCYPCNATGEINWDRWKNNKVYWTKTTIAE